MLLQVHGGAWTIGKKDQQGIPLMYHLAAKGWICVAINYRLAPRDRSGADHRRQAGHRLDQGQHRGVRRRPRLPRDHRRLRRRSPHRPRALTPNDPVWQPGFEDADTSVQAAIPHYGVYDVAARPVCAA